MKYKPIQQLKVHLDIEGNEKKLGTLAWSGRDAGLTSSTLRSFWQHRFWSHHSI